MKKNNTLLVLIFFMFLFSTGLPLGGFIIFQNMNGTLDSTALIAGGAIAVVLTILMVIASAQILKPVYKLFGYIEDAADPTKKSEKITIKGIGIFNDLIDSVDDMCTRNEEVVRIGKKVSKGEFDNLDIKLKNNDPMKAVYEKLSNDVYELDQYIEEALIHIAFGKYQYQVPTDKINNESYQSVVVHLNKILANVREKFDMLSQPAFTINTEFDIQFANKAVAGLLGKRPEELVGTKCYDHFKTGDCHTENCACSQAMKVNGVATSRTQAHITDDIQPKIVYTGNAIHDLDGKVVGAFEVITDETAVLDQQEKLEMERKYEAKEVNRLLKNIKKLSQGEFDLDFHEFEVEDDLKHLSVTYKVINDNLAKSVDMISGLVHEISYVLTNLANNNLDVLVEAEYKGEFAEIRNALQKIITSLNEVVKDILVTSEEVNQGANEISTSSQSLSSGATQQASAIEEISATVTQVAAQVKENAKNAEQVKSVANNNKNSAQYSDTQMTELVTSMSDIQKSTANIQKVLKMINDIAFQTNILSLNAAVEAARAGQHGKGFAVIAEDVRNLALKSASAADETSDMLETMVQKITSGSELAYETAQSLKQIVEGADETVKISSEVASASNEQSIAVNQITLSLDQVSQVVQSTSVTARQGASTSNELREYANKLMDTVGEFRVVSEAIDWQALELKRQANILRELFEWDDSYSVEVNQMDNHHMRLFDLMNETYFALERNESRDAVRKILDELYDYTDYHFAEEEQMMLKIGYDKFDMHKELHTKFLAQIKSAIDGIDTVNLKVFKDETLEILGDWLFKHIKGIDKGYTEFAHNHDYY